MSRAVWQMKEVLSRFSLVNPFSARETVATETPQTSAISFNLTKMMILPFLWKSAKKEIVYVCNDNVNDYESQPPEQVQNRLSGAGFHDPHDGFGDDES